MIFNFIDIEKVKIAELNDDGFIIQSEQDAMDVIGDCVGNDSRHLILYQKNLSDSFFELKTRLAGMILQKFVNYHFRVVIVGDFSNVQSKSLRDFIYESNRRRVINFVSDRQVAISLLIN